MASPPVGLDITATSLVAVSLKRKGKAYGIVTRAESPLAPGIVVDGEVSDADALGAAIKAFWAEHGIKDKTVSVGVANQRCITRVIEKVRIKGGRKQLREALSFDVAEHLPIPLEEAVWDFHTVAKWKHEDTGADMERHIVVMVYRESVERYRDAIATAGLKLARIDLAAFALMRAGLPSIKLAFQSEDLEEQPVVAILDVGSTSTNVVISRDDICELNRIVGFGRQHFTQTLVEQFGWETADAERVTGEAGITPLGGMETPGDPYADARRIMQFVADQFAQEIRTSFDYYTHSSGGANRVGRVVIAGEGALLRGIEHRFAQELGVPVSVLDASPRLDPSAVEELGTNHPRYGTALGLAMEEAA
ncbi:MAG: type IV pilus assembly protein PilM [Thermoleophilia bacterium]|nr:type IV pilus assembly protein PilM [Thermoleophilia bacterium]